VVAPLVGRLIDRHGRHHLLAASNLVIAAGLLILGTADITADLVIAWTMLGVGIGMGLYDPAFATLTWLYGRDARSSITGITLIAGFASTIGWPLTAAFLDIFGWRAACLVWAGLNMLLAAPVNWLAIPRHGVPAALPQATTEIAAAPPPRAAMPILAFFFAATWFVQGAMAAHLPGLLQAAGASSTAAIAAASLVGPAQVGARIVEFRLLRSFHPISSARLASALHPIGAAFLVALGAPGIIAFALLHGAGNGMITIAKGTLPLALFGPRGYGLRSGLLSARPGCCKRQLRFCLVFYSTGSGSARSDYQLGCVSPLSPRCTCCGRAAPSRRIPCRSAVWARIARRRYCPGIASSRGRYVSRG
jgi:MFS family permease